MSSQGKAQASLVCMLVAHALPQKALSSPPSSLKRDCPLPSQERCEDRGQGMLEVLGKRDISQGQHDHHAGPEPGLLNVLTWETS